MSFGKIAGPPSRERRRGSLLVESGRLELLDLAAVKQLLQGLSTPPLAAEARAAQALEQATLLRELARRTGERSWLAQSASAANRAARHAGPDTRLFAAARLQYALGALAGSDLFADADGEADAAAALAEAEAALGCAPGRLNGPGLVRARLGARSALVRGDREAVMAAATRFEDAAGALEARVRATGAGEPEWAAALCERGELMIAYGQTRKEAGLLDRSSRDLASVAARLDPTRLPLSWMRAETLHGTALRALGETTGEAALLKDAAHAFAGAWDAIPVGHSPLDRARAAHGLGLTLHALGEASGEQRAFASAQVAFDQALSEAGSAAGPFRSIAAYDRAACLARRAERSGDVVALSEAEAAFRADLAARQAERDPVAWAVVQVALARIYEARADLAGDTSGIVDAAFALSEALDVFRERGLRTLSDVALTALERLKARR